MTAYVFLGPTLPLADALAELDAVYLPPVAQGDVYRVTRLQPDAIGIVDGYFDRVPAVWHKEILWAMSCGIPVFGSASMGALRAAELAPFGMRGIGRVFADFRDGVLEDDDEVALAHTADGGEFRPVSEAMVNVRATLRAAGEAGVIDEACRRLLLRAAKRLFYADRAYPNILRDAARDGAGEGELNAFASWLPRGRVDVKRLDALEMLRAMRTALTSPARESEDDGAGAAPWAFAESEVWTDFTAGQSAAPGDIGALTAPAAPADVAGELRVCDPDAYLAAVAAATMRVLAIDVSRQRGFSPQADTLYEAIVRLRRRLGLLEPGDVTAWLAANHASQDHLVRLAGDDLRADWVSTALAGRIAAHVPDELRRMNRYAEFAERDRSKRAVLGEQGYALPEFRHSGMDIAALMHWYFTEHRGMAEAPDPAGYAERLGYEGLLALHDAVLREYLYQKAILGPPADSCPHDDADTDDRDYQHYERDTSRDADAGPRVRRRRAEDGEQRRPEDLDTT